MRQLDVPFQAESNIFHVICALLLVFARIRPRDWQSETFVKSHPLWRTHTHSLTHSHATGICTNTTPVLSLLWQNLLYSPAFFVNGMCCARCFRLWRACVFVRRNICKINLVKTESVQSSYGFVHNIYESEWNENTHTHTSHIQVKKNIIKQNPRAVRQCRSENFIPFNSVAAVFFSYFILSPHSSHFLLGLLCAVVLLLLDSWRATISILVSARLMFATYASLVTEQQQQQDRKK